MKNIVFAGSMLILGAVGSQVLFGNGGMLQAQPVSLNGSGDALWHLPKFVDKGWFLHASNGRVRACNMDKASVIGDKQGPRCSNWE